MLENIKKMNLSQSEKIISNNSFINTYQHQNLVFSYLDPELPYRSLMLCFQLGTGKTYTAAALAFIYIKKGYKVLFLANSVTSVSNFEREYTKFLNDTRMEKFLSISKNKITCMTYYKLYYRKNIKNEYGLVILDEAHNLKSSGSRYKNIKNKLHNLNYAKILIISATPMYDSSKELPSILNLTEETPHVMFADNFTLNQDVRINYVGEKVNGKVLYLTQIKGLQLKVYRQATQNKDPVFSGTRQASLSALAYFDPKIPLDEQSTKIYALLKLIKPKETNVVFSFYVNRGINFLIQVLEHEGYVNFLYNNDPKAKTFAVITGSTHSNDVSRIIESYNTYENFNGSIINILIGSSVLSESVSLMRTNNVHILTPHWNFSQIEQSLGRVVRLNSHSFVINKKIDVYLHASYESFENGVYKGHDISILNVACQKEKDIETAIVKLKESNKIKYINQEKSLPIPDDILIFDIGKYIIDFTNTFDTNKYKISWAEFKEHELIIYEKESGNRIFGSFENVYYKINRPLPEGYTIWRSCIDNKLRISYLTQKKDKKRQKRGKLLLNLKINEITKIAKDLNCSESSVDSIIKQLKSQKRYFDKQIEKIRNDL